MAHETQRCLILVKVLALELCDEERIRQGIHTHAGLYIAIGIQSTRNYFRTPTILGIDRNLHSRSPFLAK